MNMIFQATKLIRLGGLISLSLLLITMLTACSGLKIEPAEQPEEPVSILTGKSGGSKLGDFMGSDEPNGSSPVNAILWRAALDIASYVPLSDVDTMGGSIITEWHQPKESPNERLKLSIFVVGRELRSDAIKVQAYIQKLNASGWIDAGRDADLSRKIENLILARARELRSDMMAKTD